MAPSILHLAQEVAAPLLKGQLPQPELLKLFVSKSLGYAILAGACITKLPQILTVVRSRSAAGLSPLSFELEALGLMVHTMYGALAGLPFNAYGEAAILCLQSLVLLVLIYSLSKAPAWRPFTVLTALSAFAASVISGRVGLPVVRAAFDANNLVFIAARVPQITANWRAQSTGQLSLATCAINLVGCIVRIFTSITEKAGTAMIRSYAISLVLNTTLVSQILYYGASRKPSAAGKKGAGKGKAKAAPAANKVEGKKAQ